ncbi:head decoration protein [Hyphomicrobium sp. 802]|uniref:head decoration protein n=1 Tax=Hyphomicrobium sp. 802 TaxID=1112272 RepID=UPI00045E7CD2|nr:head decoration protein [Hyphomicrobium sp. 802]
MTTLTEGRHTAEYLLSEAEGHRSRDNIKIASGAGVVDPGTVLGKITASGKYVPHAPTATDGSQTAVAINYARVDATTADVVAAAHTRDCEVRADALVLNVATDTDAEKAAVFASLASVGIVVR